MPPLMLTAALKQQRGASTDPIRAGARGCRRAGVFEQQCARVRRVGRAWCGSHRRGGGGPVRYGDGDGRADIHNDADSIHSAAHYLKVCGPAAPIS